MFIIDTKKKITLLLTLGSIFEYYDFIIYGLMSRYLGLLFFPNEDQLLSQIQAFSLFLLSYIVRPVGGVILAFLGDLKDRNRIFIYSNYFIAFSTILISLLPNYQQIGVLAPLILIVLRIIQASSFAIELPGAMYVIQENTNSPTRNFSFIVSGSAIGCVMASTSLYILEHNFSQEKIIDFAWRIPFVFGAILCLISALIRKQLLNFSSNQLFKIDFNIFLEYKRLLSVILIIILLAFLIIMNVFFPSLLPHYYSYKIKEVYLAITFSLLYSAIYAPIFSYLVSSVSKFFLLKTVVKSTILISLGVHILLSKQSFVALVVSLCIYQTIIASIMVIIFPFMTELFQRSTQFTIITACYNLSYSIAAVIFVLITNLINYYNNLYSLWIFIIVLSILILLTIYLTARNISLN